MTEAEKSTASGPNMEQPRMEDTKKGVECITQASTSQEAGSKIKQQVQSSASSNSSRAPEKKRSTSSTKQPSTSSTQQKATHALDKTNNSSAIVNPVDLQSSVFGRSNTALSAMTVPIRLDALSYLLNNALMGAYRMAPQVPFYGGQCNLPMCQSSAPLYTNPMGQVSQSSCAGHGCCPLHFTPTPQMYPTQPPVCPGNTCPDSSRLPGRQNETTIPYPPAVQRDPNAVSCNPSGAWCATNNTNMNESNKWNSNLSETLLERQKTNFAQPKSSFSGGSDGQNSPPKRSFENSASGNFGNWKDNQRGNSWSGRQQRDFDRPMGRSNDNFSSGSWRGNSRDQSRDSGFGGKPGNYDFGNRKRSQDEGSFSQDEGPSFKQGRWGNGRGRGGGRGSWQQRFDDSSARSELGNFGDRFKSGANSTSIFGQASSCSKNDNANEDWDTDYKSGKPEQSSAVTSKWASTVDKKPENNCMASAALKSVPKSSFASKDKSNDEWETEYNAEQSNTVASKAPSVLNQKTVTGMPNLSSDNTEIMESSFKTKTNTTVDEDHKVIKGVDKNGIVKDNSTLIKECNLNESDTQENSEKGMFEKFMLTDAFSKGDAVAQTTADTLEEGELIDASRHSDVGSTSLKSGESLCSSPLPYATEISCSNKDVISEAVMPKESLHGSTCSRSFDSRGVTPFQSSIYLGVHPKKAFLNKSEASDALITLLDIPTSSLVAQAVDTQTECPKKYSLFEAVQTKKELLCRASSTEELAIQKAIPNLSAVSEDIDAQEDFPVKSDVPEVFQAQCIEKKSVVLESVVTQENCANRSAVTETVMEEDVTKPSAVSIAHSIEKDIVNESLVSEEDSTAEDNVKEHVDFDNFNIKNNEEKSDASVVDNREKDITKEYVISEEVEIQMDIAEAAVTGADITENDSSKESTLSRGADTRKKITMGARVSEVFGTENDVQKVVDFTQKDNAKYPVVSEPFDSQKDITKNSAHSEAVNLSKDVEEKYTASEIFFAQQNITETFAVSEEASTQKASIKERTIFEANSVQGNSLNASAALEAVVAQKDLTHRLAVSEAVNAEDLTNTPAASKKDDTHKGITETPTVLDLVVTRVDITHSPAISKADDTQNAFTNSPALSEGLDTHKTKSASQIKDERGITLVFAAKSDSTKHIVMEITGGTDDK